MTKYEYMQLAIELARKGMGRTAPNPMVGCVIVIMRSAMLCCAVRKTSREQISM